jgi:2-desacetyl-2-hydroxyethyl bacteriochlorophyllide A dehydrogenase
MRAAVYHGPRDVRVEAVAEPASPAPTEIILDVDAAAICGTDIGEYLHGPTQIPLSRPHPASGHVGPTILGHEFVGRVAAVGDGVETLHVGDRVVSGAGVWCGTCTWCRLGRTNLCAHYYTIGLNAHGGLADQVAVPASTCFAVPGSCANEAAVVAQPMAVALHAVNRAQITNQDSVLVVGVGAIGALLVAATATRGAAEIIAADVDAERLMVAAGLGATRVVHLPGEVIAGADAPNVVLEATGTSVGLQTSLQAVRRGGRVLLVGLHAEPKAIDLLRLNLNEIDIATTNAHVCATDIPEALRVLESGQVASQITAPMIQLEAVVTDGFEAAVDRRVAGKVVVDVSGRA